MMLYDFTFFSVLSILVFVLSILSLLLCARDRAVDGRAIRVVASKVARILVDLGRDCWTM